MLRAFEMGAEGVFIAGCGQKCARENTELWVQQRVAKVRNTLKQIGLEPERVRAFALGTGDDEVGKELDQFIETVSRFYLTSTLMQEVRH